MFEQRSNARNLQTYKIAPSHLLKTCGDKMRLGICSTENMEDEKKKCRYGHDFWEERTFLWGEDVEDYHIKWNA